MASIAQPAPALARDDRFFFYTAVAMALVVIAGFSMQLAAGRSTFAAPLLVHLHALVYFGWVAIYVTQSGLAATGSIALHRRLGWLAAAWATVMVPLGFAIIITRIQSGAAPFFFQPQHFLIMNPVTVLLFAGLTAAAIVNRRRTDWHKRLHLCGMAMLVAPGFGRLLPMPLLIPWAYQAALLAGLIFPLIGMWSDQRTTGRVHPAYLWGVGAIALGSLAGEAIVYSPLGDAIYAAVVEGTPGAARPGLAFAPPPAP